MAGLGLSRKVGESIVIDGNIRVTVTESARGRCRLSIEAPSDRRIVREELLQEKGVSVGSVSVPVAGNR